MIYYSTLLIAMFITMALVPIFKSMAGSLHAVDVPSERKVHRLPMPKTGGLAMAFGALLPLLLWAPLDIAAKAIMIGAGIIVFFGFIDDIKELGYKPKFAGQLAASLVVVLYGGIRIKCLGMLVPDDFFLPEYLAVPLTVIFIVGVTNAINLADGLDGLAGGISLLSFICIAYMAFLGENTPVVLFALAMTGAIFGFLRFNTFPATVFMGDTGSQLIGFVAGALSVSLTQGSTPLSPMLPLLLLGFPILDTLTVMFERVVEGNSPFVADKKHFHHKLLGLGFFHTEAVFIIYILQAFLVTSAFIFRFYSDWLLLAVYVLFSSTITILFLVTDRTGWKFKRSGFFDVFVKGRLKVFKDKNIFIKISFNIFKIGIPILFFLSCLIPGDVPEYFSLFAAVMAVLLFICLVFRAEWLAAILRISLYMLIPFVIYLAEVELSVRLDELMNQLFIAFYAVMVIFMMVTLRLTRRQKGFKSSPMDFLVLFVALVVPNLPDQYIQSYDLGGVAAKIIVLFFSYEVLIGELRGKLNWVVLSTITGLVALSLKGVVF